MTGDAIEFVPMWLESRRDEIIDQLIAGEITFAETRRAWQAAVIAWCILDATGRSEKMAVDERVSGDGRILATLRCECGRAYTVTATDGCIMVKQDEPDATFPREAPWWKRLMDWRREREHGTEK